MAQLAANFGWAPDDIRYSCSEDIELNKVVPHGLAERQLLARLDAAVVPCPR